MVAFASLLVEDRFFRQAKSLFHVCHAEIMSLVIVKSLWRIVLHQNAD